MKIKIADLTTAQNFSRPFGVGSVDELSASMETNGQITPIIVKDGVLVAGFRRYAAAVKLGWTEIEAVECVGDPGIVNLIENMQREGLSLWDEIQAIRSVFGAAVSQSEVSRQLSKSRNWVRPRVEIWGLPGEFIDKVRDGRSGIAEIRKMLRPRKPTTETVDERLPVPKVAEIKELVTWLVARNRMAEATALAYACGSVPRSAVETDSDKTI